MWRLASIATVALGATLAGVSGPATRITQSTSTPPPPTARDAAAASEGELRELDIAWFSARAKRDPTGALDLAKLGALYLERGRASGDPRDAILAERAARRSLKNRGTRNVAALQLLQSSLLAQHRFAEALALAKTAMAADPDNAAQRAAVGEIEMELGQYDSARVSFTDLRYEPGDPSIAPRLARWAELRGDTAQARRLLADALRNVRRSSNAPREQVAWYWLRVGDVELRAGRWNAADSAYLRGLQSHPDDYRLLSALARSALHQRNPRRAVFLGEKAIGMTLDPATLGTLSEAWAAVGDTAKSNEYADALDVSVRSQPGEYHRAWSLFLLDHGRRVSEVARRVREELRGRQDVYAYDLHAWALHHQGRDREARVTMARALSLGTKDALLFRHAAVIDASLGHMETARAYSRQARALDPGLADVP